MVLLIALLGAILLLSGLVLLTGYLRRSQEPLEFPASPGSPSGPLGASPAADTWMLGGPADSTEPGGTGAPGVLTG